MSFSSYDYPILKPSPLLIHIFLFISYKFGKHFLAITFLLFLFLAETYMICVNVFYVTRKECLVRTDKNAKFNHRLLLSKTLALVYRHDVTKVCDFYKGGLRGNSLSFVGSSWNFVSDYKKNVDAFHESCSSEKTSYKKVIAKKPLTNLYEMKSRR